MCRLCLAIELDVDEDRVSNFGAIDNGAAANTIDLASAESELHLHTTTLDVIASLCNCMYGLWAESHSVQFPDARVEAGVEDEASEFRFKPTAKEDARVLVVAAIQPNVRAMRHGEMLVRRSGVGPVVANYSRGADLTVHIARLWFCTVVCHFYDDTILFGCSWERGGAQDCYRQLQNCLHRRHSRVHAYLAQGRS